MKNILIVDSDLGFVFWLGQTLDAAGYDTLPAKGVPEAVAILARFRVFVDVLIMHFNQPGADAFVAQLRHSQGGILKTIGLLDDADDPTAAWEPWDAWQVKPELPDQSAKATFLTLVQSVLEVGTTVRGI